MKNLFLFAHCEELTPEERIERLRELGYTDEDIAKLSIQLPKGFKVGKDKIFTQNDITKARSDVRRQLEGNAKYKQQNSDLDDDLEDDDDITPANPPKAKKKAQAGLTAEDVQALISQAVSTAVGSVKDEADKTIEALQNQLKTVSDTVEADKKKAYDKRKAELSAQLPEEVQSLLVGDTIEALEASFGALKAFVDKTTAEVKASVTATEATRQTQATAFFTSQDGTVFASVNDIMAHKESAKYLTEFKNSKRTIQVR